MKMTRRRIVASLFFSSAIAIGITQCTQDSPSAVDPRGETYAAPATCIQCHRPVVDGYLQHAHFHSSQEAPDDLQHSPITLHTDTFVFNENTKVGIEHRSDGWYQVAHVNGKNVHEERIDLVFGAGESAYTFGFWHDDKLMQHPLNYMVNEQEWVNSPGFPAEQIYFGRTIVTRCLECHSSFVQSYKVSTGPLQMEETFDKSSLLLGIDCQRCHGPAAEHVQFHQAHPDAEEPHAMVRFGELSRIQKMDACGICHSGTGVLNFSDAFFFKPGDTLHYFPEYSDFIDRDPDVHGKQKQLLEASQCYLLSDLDCTTCHSSHTEEVATLASYSQKCIQCHQQVDHTAITGNAVLQDNCIDCHMPIRESKVIGFQRSEGLGTAPYKQRTHRIAVYLSELE